MFGIKKYNRGFSVLTVTDAQFIAARTILDEKFVPSPWSTDNWISMPNNNMFLNHKGEVHTGDSCGVTINFRELLEWSRNGWEMDEDVKEMTVAEISEKLGYEVKIVK